MHITTRPARRADINQLQRMITALAAFHQDTATLDLDALNRDVFGARPWVHVSVALIAEEITGYVACCPVIKLQFCARGLDLHHVYVDPAHRGKGVGRALIHAAEDRALALDCTYMMVGTSPENANAKAAYIACGFTPTAHNPNRFHMALS